MCSRILSSRLCRCLICLLLVGCFLIYSSPLRAHATAAVAPVVSSVAVVSVPGALVVGATLIALGVYAGVETGAFESLANSAVDFLDTAGGWIKDGSMELLKTVDSAGKATYYAAGDLLETLRGWVVSDSGFIKPNFISYSTSQSVSFSFQTINGTVQGPFNFSFSSDFPFSFVCGVLQSGSYFPGLYIIADYKYCGKSVVNNASGKSLELSKFSTDKRCKRLIIAR